MEITRLALRDFRNIAEAEIAPHPRFNVICGENGQGKTNLLEAMYWLSTLRPLRASRLRELVRWGEKATRVDGDVLDDGLVHRLTVEVRDGDRKASREGKAARAAQYFGALAVVMFTPDDVGMVRGSPELRRRFLDRAIFTGQPAHLNDVLTFRRALSARNRLLREGASGDLIDVYEATLATQAARLMAARRAYVAEIAPRFTEIVSAVAGAELKVTLTYRPSLNVDPVDDPEALHAAWSADRQRDRERGFTQRGPQADDLSFGLLDRSARNYASQGQQRAMVLALKIAEIQLLEERRRCTPSCCSTMCRASWIRGGTRGSSIFSGPSRARCSSRPPTQRF